MSSPLVDQQTLEALEPVDGGWRSPRADRFYPQSGGLLFMGYDARKADQTEHLIEEERVWQRTTESVEGDEQYLREVLPGAVTLLRLARSVGGVAPPARALDLGSGAGWGAWLLAEAGYDTWLVDFEANSVSLGLVYDHPRLVDRRVVADATLPPFGDASFDLVVVSQQFIHHIDDKRALLAEVNRILRPGGVFALTDPTRSLWTVVGERRHPDPHEAHRVAWPHVYLAELKRAGLTPVLKGPSIASPPASWRSPRRSSAARRNASGRPARHGTR